MNSPVKIVLVDDHQMILDSLTLLFNLLDTIQIVNSTHDSREVMSILKKHDDVDVLVTDLKMPHVDGIKLTKQVKEAYPDLRVLMLSVNEDIEDIQGAFAAGASGYVMKKASRQELEKAVLTVALGKKYFGQDVMEAMLSPRKERDEVSDIQELTKALTNREKEIIKLLAKEMSSTDIAKELHISAGTVDTHRHNILRKLNVKSTIGVIKFAIRAGLAT